MYDAKARHDWDQTSQLWTLLANINRNSKDLPEPFTFEDIHPFYREQETSESGEAVELANQINSLMALPPDVLAFKLDQMTESE